MAVLCGWVTAANREPQGPDLLYCGLPVVLLAQLPPRPVRAELRHVIVH